jgi:hypothetical protein
MFSLPLVPARVRARTVLLRVTPTPATLTERRAVLGLLKKHGTVEVFKKLRVRRPGPSSPCLPCAR